MRISGRFLLPRKCWKAIKKASTERSVMTSKCTHRNAQHVNTKRYHFLLACPLGSFVVKGPVALTAVTRKGYVAFASPSLVLLIRPIFCVQGQASCFLQCTCFFSKCRTVALPCRTQYFALSTAKVCSTPPMCLNLFWWTSHIISFVHSLLDSKRTGLLVIFGSWTAPASQPSTLHRQSPSCLASSCLRLPQEEAACCWAKCNCTQCAVSISSFERSSVAGHRAFTVLSLRTYAVRQSRHLHEEQPLGVKPRGTSILFTSSPWNRAISCTKGSWSFLYSLAVSALVSWTGDTGQLSWSNLRKGGRDHHNPHWESVTGMAPCVAMSAGLSSPGTCFHDVTSEASWILATQLPTKTFKSWDCNCNQKMTSTESVQ